MKKLKAILFTTMFALAVCACGTSVSDLEDDVMQAYNEQYGSTQGRATDLTLTHVEGNNYSGMITIDGDMYNIDVIFDGRSFTYQVY